MVAGLTQIVLINKRRLSVWVFHSCLHLGRFIGVHPKEAITNLDLTLGQFIYFSQTLLMLFSLKPHSLLCIKNIIAMITADLSINSCSPPQTSQQISEGCSSEIKDCLNYNPRWYWTRFFVDPLILVLSYNAIFYKSMERNRWDGWSIRNLRNLMGALQVVLRDI